VAEEGNYSVLFLLEYFGLMVWVSSQILKGAKGFVALCQVFDRYAGLLLRFSVLLFGVGLVVSILVTAVVLPYSSRKRLCMPGISAV
jgi:hypothetical protein